MSEAATLTETNDVPAPRTRTRSNGKTEGKKRSRSNYQADLAVLKDRVDTAVKLLNRAIANSPADDEMTDNTVTVRMTVMEELVRVAVQKLKGE